MLAFASTEGTSTIAAPAPAFVAAFARRVESGLLASRSRNHYVTVGQGADHLDFRAADWPTALNVGLNDVHLIVTPDHSVRYTIRYRRWALFVLMMSAAFLILIASILLMMDMRGYIETHSASRVPGLSTNQNLAVAWGMGLFWGLVWPWVLIFLHKRPLRRLMERIISEVDHDSNL
jgi:hypothetical protein